MDILRTGAIDCVHAAGECKACSVRLEHRCRAPQQEPQQEECTCPQQEGLEYDGHFAPRSVHAIISHECPVHGAPLGPR